MLLVGDPSGPRRVLGEVGLICGIALVAARVVKWCDQRPQRAAGVNKHVGCVYWQREASRDDYTDDLGARIVVVIENATTRRFRLDATGPWLCPANC